MATLSSGEHDRLANDKLKLVQGVEGQAQTEKRKER